MDAERATGIYNNQISHVCIGRKLSADGFYWCHVDNYKNYVFKKYNPHNKPKPVLQINKISDKIIKTFDSAYNAARELNMKATTIRRVLMGRKKSTHGYKFKFAS